MNLDIRSKDANEGQLKLDYPDFHRLGPSRCSQAPNPEIFFPEPTDPDMMKKQKKAKEYCNSCQYSDDCREWAIQEDEPGVWGATSRNERRNIKRARISLGLPTFRTNALPVDSVVERVG